MVYERPPYALKDPHDIGRCEVAYVVYNPSFRVAGLMDIETIRPNTKKDILKRPDEYSDFFAPANTTGTYLFDNYFHAYAYLRKLETSRGGLP